MDAFPKSMPFRRHFQNSIALIAVKLLCRLVGIFERRVGIQTCSHHAPHDEMRVGPMVIIRLLKITPKALHNIARGKTELVEVATPGLVGPKFPISIPTGLHIGITRSNDRAAVVCGTLAGFLALHPTFSQGSPPSRLPRALMCYAFSVGMSDHLSGQKRCLTHGSLVHDNLCSIRDGR